jgi:DNA repair protein RadC
MTKRFDAPVRNAADGADLFSRYRNRRREHILLATLTSSHRVIKIHVIAIGTANRTMTTAREMFYPAIVDNAVAVIAAHNHPSGQTIPSDEDDDLTRMFVAAGKLLGIRALDHIIVAKDGFYSYAQSGKMEDVAWEDVLAAELSTLKTPPSSTS